MVSRFPEQCGLNSLHYRFSTSRHAIGRSRPKSKNKNLLISVSCLMIDTLKSKSHMCNYQYYTLYSSHCWRSTENYKWVRLANLSSVTQSCLTLWPHGLQHTRPPCPSPTPWDCLKSCPSSRWCHPTISSSVIPFSSRLQSSPGSGSFQITNLTVPLNCKEGFEGKNIPSFSHISFF